MSQKTDFPKKIDPGDVRIVLDELKLVGELPSWQETSVYGGNTPVKAELLTEDYTGIYEKKKEVWSRVRVVTTSMAKALEIRLARDIEKLQDQEFLKHIEEQLEALQEKQRGKGNN